jgi:hypothetical protein
MKKIALALLALGTALTAGRAQDKVADSPWYPLAVGTTWSYKAGPERYEMRVAKREKVGNTLTARIEMVKNGKVTAVEHIGLTDKGVCRFGLTLMKGDEPQTEAPVPPVLLLKVPPRKGDSFTVDSSSGTKSYKGTFKIDEESVTVPAGTYKAAIRVTSKDLEADGLKPTVSSWYAEGVGMVKQVITEGSQTITIELEKFTPAK